MKKLVKNIIKTGNSTIPSLIIITDIDKQEIIKSRDLKYIKWYLDEKYDKKYNLTNN